MNQLNFDSERIEGWLTMAELKNTSGEFSEPITPIFSEQNPSTNPNPENSLELHRFNSFFISQAKSPNLQSEPKNSF